MEYYYEQYVVSDEKKRNQKKKILLIVVMIVFILMSAFSFISIWFAGIGIELAIWIVMFLLSLASVFFIRRFRNRLDVDFDYILKDERLIVVRVFNRKTRKKYVDVEVKAISALGRVSGGNADRYMSMPQTKKLYANLSQDEDKVFYAFFASGTDRNLLFWEPDEQMLICFRRIIGRDIVDKRQIAGIDTRNA